MTIEEAEALVENARRCLLKTSYLYCGDTGVGWAEACQLGLRSLCALSQHKANDALYNKVTDGYYRWDQIGKEAARLMEWWPEESYRQFAHAVEDLNRDFGLMLKRLANSDQGADDA